MLKQCSQVPSVLGRCISLGFIRKMKTFLAFSTARDFLKGIRGSVVFRKAWGIKEFPQGISQASLGGGGCLNASALLTPSAFWW